MRWISAILAFLMAAIAAIAQTPAGQKPHFEVASIKPVGPFEIRPGMIVTGNRVDFAMPLESLIAAAYQIKNYQIAGHDWLKIQRFEVNAIIPDGAVKDQVPQMLQTLLEERFKLKAIFENREQPVYALSVAKSGPGLMNADDVAALNDGTSPSKPGSTISVKKEGNSAIFTNQPTGVVSRTSYADGKMRMEILRTAMSGLAETLTELTDHPVVDATNLTGFYKLTLEIPMEVYRNAIMNRAAPADLASGSGPFSRAQGTASQGAAGPADTPSDPPGKGLFAAVEKAGLKLELRKMPTKTLVIEQVEKNPTEN